MKIKLLIIYLLYLELSFKLLRIDAINFFSSQNTIKPTGGFTPFENKNMPPRSTFFTFERYSYGYARLNLKLVY